MELEVRTEKKQLDARKFAKRAIKRRLERSNLISRMATITVVRTAPDRILNGRRSTKGRL